MTAEAATRDAASAHDAQATEEEAAATQIVTGLAQAARDAAGSLFTAPDDALDESLRTMARRLREAAAPVPGRQPWHRVPVCSTDECSPWLRQKRVTATCP